MYFSYNHQLIMLKRIAYLFRLTPLVRFFQLIGLSSKQALISCYHCDEQVPQRRIVISDFDGAPRQLCCHGCAAVLKLVESNGLTTAYLHSRAVAPAKSTD